MSSSGPVVTAAVRRAKKFPGNTQENKKTKTSSSTSTRSSQPAAVPKENPGRIYLFSWRLWCPFVLNWWRHWLLYTPSASWASLSLCWGWRNTNGRPAPKLLRVHHDTVSAVGRTVLSSTNVYTLLLLLLFSSICVCVVYRRRKASTRMVVVYNTHRGWVIFFFAWLTTARHQLHRCVCVCDTLCNMQSQRPTGHCEVVVRSRLDQFR
jgi:hypothetical protein